MSITRLALPAPLTYLGMRRSCTFPTHLPNSVLRLKAVLYCISSSLQNLRAWTHPPVQNRHQPHTSLQSLGKPRKMLPTCYTGDSVVFRPVYGQNTVRVSLSSYFSCRDLQYPTNLSECCEFRTKLSCISIRDYCQCLIDDLPLPKTATQELVLEINLIILIRSPTGSRLWHRNWHYVESGAASVLPFLAEYP